MDEDIVGCFTKHLSADAHWGYRDGEVPMYYTCDGRCGRRITIRADRIDLVLEATRSCESHLREVSMWASEEPTPMTRSVLRCLSRLFRRGQSLLLRQMVA